MWGLLAPAINRVQSFSVTVEQSVFLQYKGTYRIGEEEGQFIVVNLCVLLLLFGSEKFFCRLDPKINIIFNCET